MEWFHEAALQFFSNKAHIELHAVHSGSGNLNKNLDNGVFGTSSVKNGTKSIMSNRVSELGKFEEIQNCTYDCKQI